MVYSIIYCENTTTFLRRTTLRDVAFTYMEIVLVLLPYYNRWNSTVFIEIKFSTISFYFNVINSV